VTSLNDDEIRTLGDQGGQTAGDADDADSDSVDPS
jgi:hypothetical protein